MKNLRLMMDSGVVGCFLENRRIEPPRRPGRGEEEEVQRETSEPVFWTFFFSAYSWRLGGSIPRVFSQIGHHPGMHLEPNLKSEI
jgi:hypothetical protein